MGRALELAAHDERYANGQWDQWDEDPDRKILHDEREQKEADDLTSARLRRKGNEN